MFHSLLSGHASTNPHVDNPARASRYHTLETPPTVNVIGYEILKHVERETAQSPFSRRRRLKHKSKRLVHAREDAS